MSQPNANNLLYWETQKEKYENAYRLLASEGRYEEAVEAFDDFDRSVFILKALGCNYEIPEKPDWLSTRLWN